MSDDTPIIWRERSLCDGVRQTDVLASMVEEAKAEGYEPCDINYAGRPNLYFREKFARDINEEDGSLGPEYWLEDGYALNVRRVDQ